MSGGCYAMAETTFALTHGTGLDEEYADHEGPRQTQPRSKPYVPVRHVRWDYADPDSTARAFDGDGWYRTGDLGYRVRDQFKVLDRKRDVLIVGGVNVFAADIEELVSGVEGVASGRASRPIASYAQSPRHRFTWLSEVRCRGWRRSVRVQEETSMGGSSVCPNGGQ
jgi:acyl-CoA synthetase (AMP-forming)/AMP-acid ligase II